MAKRTTAWRGTLGAILAAGVALGTGCAANGTSTDGGSTDDNGGAVRARGGGARVERTGYRTWPHAVRLTNGDCEVVIVPSIGRVMRYARIDGAGNDGPNALWEDPTLSGQRGLVDDTTPDWRNFGGDKVWPWPQYAWPAVFGRDWPPPRAIDQQPHALKVLPGGAVQLDSPVMAEFGLFARRTIRLADKGTRVTVTSEFVPAARSGERRSLARETLVPGSTLTPEQAATRAAAPIPAAVWEVLQCPRSDAMVARMLPGVDAAGGGRGSRSLMADDPWDRAAAIVPGVVRLERPTGTFGRKIGLEADAFASVTPDGRHLLVVRSPTARDARTGYEPAERAQAFVEPDPPADAARGRAPYVEFEFTGPRAPLREDGTTPPLVVEWELHRLPGPLADERAVADHVAGL